MRTTVTLDTDTEALLRRHMRQRKISFKQAVNDAIRAGLIDDRGGSARFETPTFDMGPPAVNLERALRLVAELEDEELARKLRVGQ